MTKLQFPTKKTQSDFQQVTSDLGALAETIARSDAFVDLELAALEVARELVREVLERRLNEDSQRLGKRVRVNGTLYKKHADAEVRVHSLAGPLLLGRATYREVGVRNGPTVAPAELQAGIVETMTPAMAHRVAIGVGQGTSRELEQALAASHQQPPSRATIERLGQRIGAATREHMVVSDSHARRRTKVPLETHSISVGLDRVSIPMAEPPQPEGSKGRNSRRKRQSTKSGQSTKKSKKRKRPRVRKEPEPFEIYYRMGYVGTVALHDRYGAQLTRNTYFAAANDDPSTIASRMMADVCWARAQRPRAPLVIVQDGAPELWNVMTQALKDEPAVRTWREVIDRFHFADRLSKAAAAITLTTEQADGVIAKWKDLLDEDDNAVETIRADLESVSSSHEDVVETLTYIRNARHRMRYASLKKASLPIGSGITEAACKTVVGHRAKRSGQRWRVDGLTNVMALRTQLLSDRLPAAIESLRKHRYTAHIALAA